MKFYIVSGEASGDLHGAELIKNIKKIDKNAEFRGWGGNLMAREGLTITKHINDLAFMGFLEVIKNLPTIIKNFRFIKNDIVSYSPDAVILIDYPGFNLRLAKFLKKKGFTVIYYIAPQAWAWKKNRVKIIKKYIDRLFVILPFEKEFFSSFGIPVTYEGHPLKEIIDNYIKNYDTSKKNNFFNELNIPKDKKIVALLPGSRLQEVEKKLPIMLETSKYFKDFKFVVAASSTIPLEIYQKHIKNFENISIAKNKTYELLANSYAALVTSGTATLETALFEVPQIVCYKSNNLSYQIAKRIIKVKYISLVNLINDNLTVKEMIQDDCDVSTLTEEMKKLLFDQNYRKNILKNYDVLKNKLGTGEIVKRIAAQIVVYVKQVANK